MMKLLAITMLTGFISIGISLFAQGQQVSITPVQFPIELQQSQKIDITQDYKGQIWIATQSDGLLKYDGEKFVVYKPEDNTNISSRILRTECVTADRNGNIWIGNYEDGIDKFDPETETFSSFRRNSNGTPGLSCDSIKNLMFDSDGMLWIGTKLGLDRLDPESGTFTQIIGKSEDALLQGSQDVRKIYQDSKGVIWIGCVCDYTPETFDPSKGGLYSVNKSTGKITHFQHDENDEHSLADPRVRAIFEDSRGVFWVGSSGDGLHTMDRETGTFTRHRFDPDNPHKLSRPQVSYTYHSADHISFINEDAEGQIWIGTFSAGLSRYDPVADKVVRFNTDEKQNKTTSNDFFSCIKTKDNLLWITDWYPGRNGNALYRVSTSLNTVNHANLGKSVYSFAQTSDSILWIGTNRGLVRKNSDDSYDTLFIIKNKTGSENSINNIEADKLNNLWVCTERGLFYFNTKTYASREYKYYEGIVEIPPADRSVYNTQLNGDGTLTLVARSGVFVLDINSGNIVDKYLANSSDITSTVDFIYDMEVDSKGNDWLATYNGLFQFDRKAKKFNQMHSEHIRIYSLYKDSRERLWIGSDYSGLFVYDLKTGNFSPFNDPGNIIRNAGGIYDITGDWDNNLWLMTRKGIVRVKPETKNAALFGKSWNIDLKSLTGSLWTSLDGQIFMGNQTGYYHFFPGDLTSKKDISPEPFISRFYAGDKQLVSGDGLLEKPVSQIEGITLSFNQNNFTIEFDNMDFLTNPSEKILEFELENYDNTWRNKNETEKAFYYNVPPGHYTFHLRAVNMYGNAGEKSLKITITPPWYNTWLAYIAYALLFALAVYLVHKFQKEKVIKAEREKTREKELAQAKEIEKAYTELKATQAQLIQSEKMASLGELTAGIAHEIQNPLNFVNNFSEVSNELIDELKIKNEKLKIDDEEVSDLLNDITQNLEKINHHGKRAESIVKGMLLHSRGSSGQKELTDINALCDEYLRLSYHGFRAKDNSFNAEFKLVADERLPKIEVVPQDIGRVLLNLINNAFFAVNERAKLQAASYKPLVTVSSKCAGNTIEICVKDNGPGIPEQVRDKIFQPFFTTKPTGQGTGLGLSLSYDIVKAHGGELIFTSDPVTGTSFTIKLKNV